MLLESTHSSIDDLSRAEKITTSYVSRVLRLAYLSPTIVEAILDGKYPAHLTLKDLMEPFPLEWDRLVAHFLSKDISPTQPICVSQEMEPSVTIFVVSDIKTLVLLRANATHERIR